MQSQGKTYYRELLRASIIPLIINPKMSHSGKSLRPSRDALDRDSLALSLSFFLSIVPFMWHNVTP